MTSRIFRSIFSVALAILLACLVLIFGILFEYYNNRLAIELQNESALIANGIAMDGESYLTSLPDTPLRITWIRGDGSVLYDSNAAPSEMENHADREEFRQAMETGSGKATRYSSTLSEKTVYYATKLTDGTVLRVSSTQYTVLLILFSMLQPIFIVLVFAVLVSLFLSSRVSKQIVKPINELDLDHPEKAEVYEELTPLLSRLYSQNRIIHQQMETLRRKQEEFTAITENMQEGFLLIDKRTELL